MDESKLDEEDEAIRRALNEAKKRELTEKFGVHFPEQPSNLPPDIESQGFNYIEEFESQFENAPRVSVRQFLGFPSFKPLDDIPPELVEAELQSVFDLLLLHGIVVDCLVNVTSADLYKFITSELIDEEIDEIHIEGLRQCFIYEDFHPNDEYDAKSTAENFLWDLFEKHEEWAARAFSVHDAGDSSGDRIDDIQRIIRKFYDTYACFTHHAFECIGCLLEGEYAAVTVRGTWSALTCVSLEAVSQSGQGTIRVKKSPYGGYDVVRVNIPGLQI